MKIQRSPKIQEQVLSALALRNTLIDKLEVGLGKEKAQTNELFQTVNLSAEGFVPSLVAIGAAQLDRTASMLAGPFFTSAENPIPVRAREMMMPVVQLNLKEMSELSGLELGDGLLQLWCDPDWEETDRGLVFVIPRAELDSQTLTPFAYTPHPAANESPLPEELIFNPSDDEVKVISGYESLGLQCQTGYLDVYTDEIADEVRKSIQEELMEFQELTKSDSSLHVLGTFYPIQYSAADVGWRCLMSFPRWGSSGNAQIFFEVTEEGMTFRFDESLR